MKAKPIASVVRFLVCIVLLFMPGLFLHGAATVLPESSLSATSASQESPGASAAATSPASAASSPTAPSVSAATVPAISATTTSAITNCTGPALSVTPASFVLTAVGDIILHQSVIDGGLHSTGISSVPTRATQTTTRNVAQYRYDHLFQYVSSYFTASDYAIANYEGTLNGPPYSGYPMFGAPDAITTAMKTAGFDMVTTANNHAFDRKLAGLVRTPKIFRQAGIEVVGTRSEAKEPVFQIIERNGIKIGVTAYTWETIGTDTNRALNSIPLPKEANALVDSFNPSRATRYEQDKQGMKRRIQEMRDAGADSIVFLMHWGVEYKTVSNDSQRKLAQFLADSGVDVIIGHHPHVLQEISILKSAATGKGTLVYYSLGNFLSNMEYSTHGTNGNAEDAVIAKVTFQRSASGEVRVTKGEYIKTYAWKDKSGGRLKHRILPVMAAATTPRAFGLGGALPAIRMSAVRIDKVLGASVGTKHGIRISESLLAP